MPLSITHTAFSLFLRKIESQLKKSKTGWLAGGDNPTSADFMMGFAAEVLVASAGDLVGPKTKEYVKHIHDR
jgi:glutathione S-transferase